MRAGASLEQRVGAPIPIEELLPLAIQLAGELAELHGRGAIHGDVRPATIRFDAATGRCGSARAPARAAAPPRSPRERCPTSRRSRPGT